MSFRSTIFITREYEAKAEELKEKLLGKRVVAFVREKFLLEDAKAVIEEAYISEEQEKYILLAANEYNVYSQNALLKILEEPPRNIIFLLVAPTKSALLPTVRSRLPLWKEKSDKEFPKITIDLAKLDLAQIFTFLQEHKHIAKNEAKALVEALYKRALEDGVKLSTRELENFDMAYRLLELNGRAAHILQLLLMGFLHEN